MTKKKLITISSATVCVAAAAALLAIFWGGDKGPDFAGKNPEQIKEYFNSKEYQSLDIKEQIALKKKAYGPIKHQYEQELIEQVKTYSQLSHRQKVAYLDEMIDEIVADAEKKQSYAKKAASGAKQAPQGKTGDVNSTKKNSGKNWDSPEGFRGWSENMDSEKRAYILELKEAMIERMEQRGIDIFK